ncbi:MAG: fused NADH-quinone oxidoreductase subunit E/endonuclease, partial [Rhodobacteraceae bacterium]|nr:fused NADH-quinone oxidoreductase subunit E/endonuclease [Paracoccaceae bacterium]
YHSSQISKWNSDEIHWVHSNSSGSLSLNKLKSFVEQAKKLQTNNDG